MTDKMIARMNRRMIRKFNHAKEKMELAKFDELNVLRTVRGLYEDLDDDFRAIMLSLIYKVYEENSRYGKMSSFGAEELILWILSEPNPVTGYSYTAEVWRKRDYLVESLKASDRHDAAIRKAMSYWARMTAQYADIFTENAMLKAFEDAGIRRVRWHTRDDERVCKACNKRHGRIYPINRIPVRPHWGCRCWWEPVT